jgi:phosphate transport system substrate-binding protein
MRKLYVTAAVALAASSSISLATPAFARDTIRVVGSSTVFPFATAVAEQFGKTTNFKVPVVESTGSGGGLKLFCEGIGLGHPDVTNASRRIKSSEVEKCAANGVADVVEVKIGYDGIVIANSRQTDQLQLTLRDVYLALAKEVPGEKEGELVANPHMTWNDVNPSLPDYKIAVLGPPPTSGTRDAFAELALEGGCKTFDWIKAMKKQDKARYKEICHTVREDGGYIEAGENDNLIVQKLEANPEQLGVFGYSFLDQNGDKVQGSSIGGVNPTFEAIASGDYPVSRALFFYVKKDHVGVIPGIDGYIAEFTSEKAWGPEGYLADKGLIPMSDGERDEWRTKATALTNLSM